MASVLRSSLLNLAATIVSLIAGFATSIITARLLGPGGSGTVAFAIWAVTSASAIADFGMPQTLLRHVGSTGTDDRAWKMQVRAAFRVFVLPVGAVAMAMLGYSFLARIEGGWDAGLIWTITTVLFLAYALAHFSGAIARGRDRFSETAASTVIGCLLQIPLVFAGAWFFGPAGALAGMIIRYLPQGFRLRRYLDLRLPVARSSLTTDMRAYGRQMWLSDLVDVVGLSRIEFLFLGFFFSSTEVGYFAAAMVFAGLVGQLTLQISPALIVGFSSAGTSAARFELYRQSLRTVALVMFPISLGGAAIIPELLPLLLGEEFRPAATAASLLLGISLLPGLAVVPWGFLAGSGSGQKLLSVMLISAIASAVLLVVAVPLLGVLGAALARTCVEALSLAMLLLIASRAGARLPGVILLKTLTAAIICGLVAYGTTQLLGGGSGIVLAIVLGAFAYLLAVRAFCLIEASDTQHVETIAGRLPASAARCLRLMVRLIAPIPA
jgi:O-antigen/teichoic acid export membrane protein